jgi:hypothetical protein
VIKLYGSPLAYPYAAVANIPQKKMMKIMHMGISVQLRPLYFRPFLVSSSVGFLSYNMRLEERLWVYSILLVFIRVTSVAHSIA